MIKLIITLIVLLSSWANAQEDNRDYREEFFKVCFDSGIVFRMKQSTKAYAAVIDWKKCVKEYGYFGPVPNILDRYATGEIKEIAGYKKNRIISELLDKSNYFDGILGPTYYISCFRIDFISDMDTVKIYLSAEGTSITVGLNDKVLGSHNFESDNPKSMLFMDLLECEFCRDK